MASLIAFRSVSRHYDAERRSGVTDVTFDIFAGDFIAIVGPSGAGKSTLLNLLGMLDRADAGQYLFAGSDIAGLSERDRDHLRSRSIGFVFQSAFVLGEESTLQNAALSLQIQGSPLRERGDRAMTALERFGLRGRASSRAKLLSGGERQRLAIARAITTDPLVILADEPTGNLDSENGRIVMDDLRRLNEEGATVIVVTHDPDVAAVARRRFLVDDGQVTEQTPPEDAPPRSAAPIHDVPARVRPHLFRRMWDELADAIASLSHQLRRTTMVALVFAIGIGGLTAATAISSSASGQVALRLTEAALDEVRVALPGDSALLTPGDGRLQEWIASASALPHVRSVAYSAMVGASSANIRRLDAAESRPDTDLLLMAASPAYLALVGASAETVHSLRLVTEGGVPDVGYVGVDAAEALGVPSPGPGSSLWVDGRRISILGVLHGGADHPEVNRTLLVSPDVVAGSTAVSVGLFVRTDPGFPAAVADALPLALDAANPGAFSVETVPDLRDVRRRVAGDLGALVGILSAVLLVLAAISASATQYLSVRVRTPEIALRRALGARRSSIARLFLIEGILVGLGGGAVGAALGVLATILAARWQEWSPLAPPELVPVGVLLGVVTGIASAALPAWTASRQQPAAAIRG